MRACLQSSLGFCRQRATARAAPGAAALMGHAHVRSPSLSRSSAQRSGRLDHFGLRAERQWRSLASVAQDPASHTTSSGRRTPAPDVESSLDSIVPDTLFSSPPSNQTEQDTAVLPRQMARQAVATVLNQLRDGVHAASVQSALAAQHEADITVREMMKDARISAKSLHHFCIQLMKQSRDPRRMPIASRLFVVAFGIDPMTLSDPTAPANGDPAKVPDESLASQPLAGADAWAVNAAGYNWASMVLSGQAAPPAGLHLLQRGSTEARELIKDQQAAAVRVYATLAMRGDAQGMLGMGRILLASMRRSNVDGGDAEGNAKLERETTMMRNRAISLWVRAGEKGVADAWFELGLLSLGSTDKTADDASKAQAYFERGAEAGSSRCHHALAVLLTQRAMQDIRSPPSAERLTNLEKSMEHFRKAALMGDGQSAHHAGMRYLLRDELIEEVASGSEADGRSPDQVHRQAAERHKALWGVEADDEQARNWFALGSEAGFMPAMMNLAGMLFEGRGREDRRQPQSASDENASVNSTASMHDASARLQDLRKAESLYAKVAAQAGVMSKQQQAQHDTNSSSPGVASDASQEGVTMTAEMAEFAQQALGKVQESIKQLVNDKARK